MLIFISGGVRSGKSALGEELVEKLAGGRKIYLATSRPYDDEMRRRVQKHRGNRAGKGYLTIEKYKNIGEAAASLNGSDTVLLDCLGNLLANEMFGEGRVRYVSETKSELTDRIFFDLSKINRVVANLIIISNDVFASGITYSRATEDYLEVLGMLHVRLAAEAQQAIECAAGEYICHKKENFSRRRSTAGREEGLG